ncbi:hypothetical protein RIF29_25354 [Crotalaria pallida]|uniref:Uncharacterized protein n=1 Tax=Crotalaria pallida TaxID=3830 RepID=A0AAN9ENU7_CROPI
MLLLCSSFNEIIFNDVQGYSDNFEFDCHHALSHDSNISVPYWLGIRFNRPIRYGFDKTVMKVDSFFIVVASLDRGLWWLMGVALSSNMAHGCCIEEVL